MSKTMVICDLDGTVCNAEHRIHYAQRGEWDQFHALLSADRAYTDVVRILTGWHRAEIQIVFMTGRPERYRPETIDWLMLNALFRPQDYTLLMRPNDDYQSDFVLKAGMVLNYGFSPERTLCVLEDRDRVVTMWRDLGFTCLQPRHGDY